MIDWLLALVIGVPIGLLVALNLWHYYSRKKRSPAERWREEQKNRITGDR